MLNLEMIECPRCGNDFPLKRKELGFFVCVNCSTTKPKVAITTVEGSGDHTWNDIIIMDQDEAAAIAKRAAELEGKKAHIEMLDLDVDEEEVTQVVKEKVNRILDEDLDDEDDQEDDNEEKEGIEGIDY